MKFHLMIEYNTPTNPDGSNVEGISDEWLIQAHRKVFEEDPSQFLNYLFNKKESVVEYKITPIDEEDDDDEDSEFKCGLYYYQKNLPNNICLKYGALCSHSFCEHIK